MRKHIVLCLGSNSGKRGYTIATVIESLSHRLRNFRCSHVYETPAVGGASGPYLNAVAEGDTTHSLEEVVALAKQMETDNGRDAAARSAGLVPIDIDVVIYDGEIVRRRDFDQHFFQIGWRRLHPDS